MKLTAYVIDGHPRYSSAPVERAWMDNTDQRYAYRCLIGIANARGWECCAPGSPPRLGRWPRPERGEGHARCRRRGARVSHFGKSFPRFTSLASPHRAPT